MATELATDLTLTLTDRPGTLAAVCAALGRAGVNLDGLCAFTAGGVGVVHVLVADAGAARRALQDAGLEVQDERGVLVLDVEDRPGAAGELVQRIAAAGANADLVYVATGPRLVVGADDLERARAAVAAG